MKNELTMKYKFQLTFGKLLIAVFTLSVVLPFLYTFISALFFEGSFGKNLLNKVTLYLLLKSVVLSSIVALFSTLFGAVSGFLLYKTKIAFRGVFKIALLLPLFVSPYILAVAWKDFFFSVFSNTSFISSYIGVIFVLTVLFTPLSMLIVGSALSNINSHFEESGLLITSFRTVVLKIDLPLIKPALIASFVLVFIFSVSEFSVPAFFGVKVFTTEIFTQFSAFYNHSLAIAQSALLVIICLLLLFSEKKYISDAPFFSIDGKGTSNKIYDLQNGNLFGFIYLSALLIVSVILPFVILFVQSFKDGTGKFIQAFELLAPTFANSILLAVAGALLIVLIGFTAANYSVRQTNSGKAQVFNWLLLLIFAIPSTVFGISLIKFYNRPIFNFIYSSYAIILIGYAGKFSFISAKLIENALKQIPSSLNEVAVIEGVSPLSRLIKIFIPLILPTLFAAFIIGFIFSLGELGITIMVYPPGSEIMPIKVFTIMANAPQSLTSSMSLIVFSITLLIISLFFFSVKPFFKNYNYLDD